MRAEVEGGAGRSHRLAGAPSRLDGLDLPTGIRLARAFSSYFHLANLAEQVHRHGTDDEAGVPGLPFVAGANSPTPRAPRSTRPRSPTWSSASTSGLVFTAHPTEATRRSVSYKRRQIAQLLTDRHDPRSTAADRTRIDRHVSEAIDLLWQTDELRLERARPRR